MNSRTWLYGGLGAAVLASWAALGDRPTGDGAARAAVAKDPIPPMELQTSAPSLSAERKLLEPALRDPFVAVASVPPPAPSPVAQKPAPPAPPPPPAAPALNLRYAGRMVSPEGAPTVFALFGLEPVLLAAGVELPNGYRVDKVGATAVELTYPPLDVRARLDIPPAPTFEIR